MEKAQREIWITIFALGLSCIFGGECAADDGRMVISVKTRIAVINWKSWRADYEPLHIKADHDEAIIIFRFEHPPTNPRIIGVTSNAAIYVDSEFGLIPITDRAKENPEPDIELERKD